MPAYNELVWNVLKGPSALKRRCCSPFRLGGRTSSSRCAGAATATPATNRGGSLRGGLSHRPVRILASGVMTVREYRAGACLHKRWCAFGCSPATAACTVAKSYRVPWAYDDESCDVVRFFTEQKCRMIYLYREAARANETRYANDAGDDAGVPGRSGV